MKAASEKAASDSSRARLTAGAAVPFVGIHDVLSATLAGRRFRTLFVSGFGFAASHYGLPDVGFVTWSDLLDHVSRIRTVLPKHELLVDIDDGFGDSEVAVHVARQLERVGAWGIVLEDQARPRRCGHLGGKLLLGLEEYLEKLSRILAARSDLFVVARTDAAEEAEILRRVTAFADAGADAVLVDGVTDLGLLGRIREQVECPLALNQIVGGNTPHVPLSAFADVGVQVGIYSTPALFAAQAAIEDAVNTLADEDGRLLGEGSRSTDLASCQAVLQENLRLRDSA